MQRSRRPHETAVVPPPGGLRRFTRHWPTLLVAAYTLAAFSWAMPPGLFPPKPLIDRAARLPFLALGLWQSWDMFSPDPRIDDMVVELEFTTTTAGGVPWRQPLTDMVTMPYVERWRKDRWRKFCNDHLRLDAETVLWQPFVEHAVRRQQREGRDPTSVVLVRRWRTGEWPVHPGLRADVRQSPWQSHRFHVWSVPPGWGR